MSMIKVLSPDDWGFDVPPVSQIKAGRDGLSGDDLRSFIKRAGHYLADVTRKIDFAPGEVPLHLIALGSTEWWSANRNGDGWKEKACKELHPTFEKYARWYRSHINRDPAQSYGIVKKSLYNPEMHRIELIVGLNGTKEAAKRNGGLIADQEMDKLASGKDLPVSMSFRCLEDFCSFCNHKAKRREDYCNENTCGGGGLKKNIGTLLKCGHLLHADNREGSYFDISHVGRPADRTAYVTGLLDKIAGSPPVSGAALAEAMQIQAPDYLPEDVLPLEGLHKLAQELLVTAAHVPDLTLALGKRPPLQLPSGRYHPGDVLAALAKEGCVLPVEEFLYVVSGNREKAAAAAPGVRYANSPVAINCLLARPDKLPQAPINDPRVVPGELRKWASAQAPEYSLLDEHVLRRRDRALLDLSNASTSPLLNKSASASEHELARACMAYSLEALRRTETLHSRTRLTRAAWSSQNHLC